MFAVGSLSARLTETPMLHGGIRQILVGGLAATVTYTAGGLVGVSVG